MRNLNQIKRGERASDKLHKQAGDRKESVSAKPGAHLSARRKAPAPNLEDMALQETEEVRALTPARAAANTYVMSTFGEGGQTPTS